MTPPKPQTYAELAKELVRKDPTIPAKLRAALAAYEAKPKVETVLRGDHE